MNTWICNDSSGKYLYAEAGAEDRIYENSMIRSINAENILPANMVYKDGTKCYECDISGYDTLKKYFSIRELNTAYIRSLLIEINTVVSTVKNYLLAENDILLDLSRIFVDTDTNQYKFCVIPGVGNDFEKDLKDLIYELLVNIDCNDMDALRMGFKLLKTSSDPEYKLHDVMDVIRKNQAPPQKMEQEEVNRFSKPYIGVEDLIPSAAEEEFFTESKIAEDEIHTEEIHHVDEAPEQEKTSWTGLLLSQGILFAAVGAVFLLKGKTFVLKLLPLYIILAICITAFYLVEGLMKKVRGFAV